MHPKNNEDMFCYNPKIIVPLLTVLWTYVDLGLQINQSITYYQHAEFNNNNTYQTLESNHSNATHQPYLHSGSHIYFYVSVVVWIVTPILRPLGLLWIDLNQRAPNKSPNVSYGPFVGPFIDFFCNGPCAPTMEPCTCRCLRVFDESFILGCRTGCLLFFLYFIAAMIFILVMIPAYYIYVPILKVTKAFKPHEDPPWWMMFEDECVFEFRIEAIPQLILATVYFAKNYGFVQEHEDNLGIGLPVTAISCIFSSGSVVIILITGLKAMWSKSNK